MSMFDHMAAAVLLDLERVLVWSDAAGGFAVEAPVVNIVDDRVRVYGEADVDGSSEADGEITLLGAGCELTVMDATVKVREDGWVDAVGSLSCAYVLRDTDAGTVQAAS